MPEEYSFITVGNLDLDADDIAGNWDVGIWDTSDSGGRDTSPVHEISWDVEWSVEEGEYAGEKEGSEKEISFRLSDGGSFRF